MNGFTAHDNKESNYKNMKKKKSIQIINTLLI